MSKNYEKTLKTKRGWTKIPNAIRHDENLTSDAKVVIEELLSVSGDFNISMKGIAKATHLSESKVKRAIDLLQDTGYLKIEKIRNGKYFGGYKWLISDVPGVYRKCTDGISMDDISISATSDYGISNDDISISTTSIGAPLYQYTERYQHTNNQKRIDQHTDEDEERENQVQSLSPYPFPDTEEFFSGKGSSEATASPLQGKKPGQGEQVLSQTDFAVEQAFNRFCDEYPNLGDKDLARATFFAIPDIDKICWQIANSVEWFEKSGMWDNWKTGQKNASCPGAVRFLKEGRWQQYLKSGATMSEEDRLRAILAKNKNMNN